MVFGTAALTMGCQPYKDTRPLTPDEYAVVGEVLTNGDRAQPGVEYLLRASNKDFLMKKETWLMWKILLFLRMRCGLNYVIRIITGKLSR